MKKLIVIACSLLLCLCLSAQQDTTINGTTFTADGKVGIGNTDPGLPLYVNGSAVFRDGSDIDVAIAKPAGKNGIIFNAQYNNPDYNYVNYSRFNMYNFPKANGTKRYFFMGFHSSPGLAIKNGGNVGIGTVDPSHKLDVRTSGGAFKTYNEGAEFTVSQPSGGWIRGFRIRNAGNAQQYATVFGSQSGSAFISTGFKPSVDPTGANNKKIVILNTGNVGIGVTNPTEKLVVDGTILSEEIKVEVVNAPDYVFAKNYDLITLKEVASYIEQHHHLPEIPSAVEMETEGVKLGLMNMRLLKKVEELTLYTIEQENELQEQRAMMQELLKEMASLRKEMREGKE